jgi:hypothetical protein
MAGISSRIGTFAIGKQSAKGTPATVPTIKLLMNGAPSLAPTKERARLSMTDAGRDQGKAFTQLVSVGGDVPVYLHPEAISLLNYLVLGENADSGGPTNYQHIATPGDDLPWFTAWRMVGNVVHEKFVDCKLNSLQIEGSAGQPLSATLGILGCTSELTPFDTALTPIDSDPYLFPDIKGRFKVDTVAQKIHQLSFGIDNGLSGYQADDYVYDDIDPGGRTVTLSFATRFKGLEAWPNYREFFYGSKTNEVQTVTITGSPTGGTFTLSFDGQTTAPIAYNAASTAVQSALEALSNLDPGDAAVSGSAGGPYTVTFQGRYAGFNVPQLVGDGTALTGGTSPSVQVATTAPGTGNELVGPVASHAFEFELFKSSVLSVKYELPQVVYTAIPVNPDPGGAPIEVQVPCEVEKPSGQNIVTATTKDQVASL